MALHLWTRPREDSRVWTSEEKCKISNFPLGPSINGEPLLLEKRKIHCILTSCKVAQVSHINEEKMSTKNRGPPEPTHSGPPRVGRARRPPVGGLRPGRPATSQLTAGFSTFPRCLVRVVYSTRADDCGGVQGFTTHPRLGSESSGRQRYGISERYFSCFARGSRKKQ